MGLGVVELVRRVGDDKLFFQNLDHVATGYQLRRGKRGEPDLTEIKFLTDAITPTGVMNGTTKMIGLVVWLPRDLVKQALAEAKAADAVDPSAGSQMGTPSTRDTASSDVSSDLTREKGKA